jgi:hypothetical protein
VEYDLFYAEKEPPENCVVWIAHRSVIEENRARPGHQLTAAAAINVLDAVKAKASDSKERIEQLPSAGTIVVATFVITRVAFQLLWHDLLGPLPLQRTTRDVYRCIWPAAERNAIWPPPAGIEDVGGFYGFHAALVDAVMAS